MPIKLKTQLRKTQEIADVIIGIGQGTKDVASSAEDQGIRVLSDLASTMQQYQNRRRSIAKISTKVLNSQYRNSLLPKVEIESSSSDSENEQKYPNLKRSKSVLVTGIQETRNKIKSIIA